ncbi:MAG: SDR family NAD(P)-dependent oxidoreductase, partial [Bacteroidales bacterium]|nr:SDR family NAD(P)-dependent oxidoreductase [Bacteroidales bacterium]
MGKMNFEGKVVVITGSSRGIGKGTAVALARKGASVVLNGRNEERL